MPFRLIAAIAAAIGVSVAAIAGGGLAASASPGGRTAPAGWSAPVHGRSWFGPGRWAPPARPSTPAGLIGRDCSSLPRSGPGSRASLAKVPVATAVGQVPLLSDLAHAIRVAGLTSTLNAAHEVTLFAADNPGFRVLGQANLQALRTTRGALARVIKIQVVRGHVTPAELRHRQVLTTLGGTRLYPVKAGPNYYVNSAWIICGNLRTTNATLYIVNNIVISS